MPSVSEGMFLRVYDYLLPRAKAWSLTVDKALRRFFNGLVGLPDDLRTFFISIYLDLFPGSTTVLPQWLAQFGLLAGGGSEAQQREALAAAWRVAEYQSPKQIQDTLQAAGFDVYVHEWWADMVPTVRIPFTYLNDTVTPPPAGFGYPLVNKIPVPTPQDRLVMGNKLFTMGNPKAAMGSQSSQILYRDFRYKIPTDPDTWPYFLYIGAQNFPDIAQVDNARKDEFETLMLKICPTEQWLGVMVEYI